MEVNNKVIHYCWFGGNPLSDFVKKCIETWKKFLPDFEIKEWNEKNFDVNQCAFSKGAYEQKKWAFVSDYTRVKVLEEFGGLYLDTDVEITKDISKFLNDDLVLGQEDSKMANAAVVWVKEKHNKHIQNLLHFYETQEKFNASGDMYDISIPRIVKKYLETIGFNRDIDEIQKIDNDTVIIYPM
ncbi:MAG: capsular polysaccharide synthesis protein, partial [Clostridia bacterium]|nr:capsular polysaccharide synthesis protein [Clostridia bacterium]